MLAETVQPANDGWPFRLDPVIVDDGQTDFSAGIVASFTGADRDYDGRPDDAVYTAELQYFRARIGDTDWDETMPHTEILVQVESGMVTGMAGNFTCTMPAHPDLEFWLPASPGSWEARDERDGHNAGSLAGTYSLRDGVIPEPASLSLLALTVASLYGCRCKRPRNGYPAMVGHSNIEKGLTPPGSPHRR
jgi:hypothetical protein